MARNPRPQVTAPAALPTTYIRRHATSLPQAIRQLRAVHALGGRAHLYDMTDHPETPHWLLEIFDVDPNDWEEDEEVSP